MHLSSILITKLRHTHNHNLPVILSNHYIISRYRCKNSTSYSSCSQ